MKLVSLALLMYINLQKNSSVYSSCFSIILQVNLPTGINPVYGHTAVAFGYGPDFKVVVMFGGKKSAALGDEISWTTLLLLC